MQYSLWHVASEVRRTRAANKKKDVRLVMAGRSATRTWMRGFGKTPWLVIISTEKDVPCANYSLLLIRSCGKEEGATLPWRGNYWLVGRWGVSEGTSLLNSEKASKYVSLIGQPSSNNQPRTCRHHHAPYHVILRVSGNPGLWKLAEAKYPRLRRQLEHATQEGCGGTLVPPMNIPSSISNRQTWHVAVQNFCEP